MKKQGQALRRDGAARIVAKARRGFTLVEVVLVVAILAMLGALVAPALSSWRGEAELIGAADEVEAGVARARAMSQRDGMPRRLALVESGEGLVELMAWAVKPESLSIGGEAPTGAAPTDVAGEGAGEGAWGPSGGEETEPSAPGRVLAEFPKSVVVSVRQPRLGGDVRGAKAGGSGFGAKGEVGEDMEESSIVAAKQGPRPARVIVLGLMLPDGTFSRAGEAVYLVQQDGAGGARRAVRLEVSSWTGEARWTEVRLEESTSENGAGLSVEGASDTGGGETGAEEASR
jgi:prepilin-type N-terminal cleavage/methylation domain-containing protein